MTGSYNNFFRVFDRTTKRDLTLEAARDIAKPKTLLKPRKVSINFQKLYKIFNKLLLLYCIVYYCIVHNIYYLLKGLYWW